MGRVRFDGKMMWDCRTDTVKHLKRFCRAEPEDADDAASQALSVAIENADAIEAEADRLGHSFADHLRRYLQMVGARELSRLRRQRGKTLSLDAPMSDDDESSDFSSAVISRAAHFDAETYCDAAKAVRLAKRLHPSDALILTMTAEGLTADDIAAETGKSAGQVRMDRARVERLMRESMKRGA